MNDDSIRRSKQLAAWSILCFILFIFSLGIWLAGFLPGGFAPPWQLTDVAFLFNGFASIVTLFNGRERAGWIFPATLVLQWMILFLLGRLFIRKWDQMRIGVRWALLASGGISLAFFLWGTIWLNYALRGEPFQKPAETEDISSIEKDGGMLSLKAKDWIEILSTNLIDLQEPVYWGNTDHIQTNHFYRFVWLRAFDRPIVVTISEDGNGHFALTKKILSDRRFRQHEPCRVEQQAVLTDDQDELRAIVSELDKTLPSVAEYDGRWGFDGSTWLIDGVNNGNYYAVHRWSPENGWVRIMGRRFLSAARIQEMFIY